MYCLYLCFYYLLTHAFNSAIHRFFGNITDFYTSFRILPTTISSFIPILVGRCRCLAASQAFEMRSGFLSLSVVPRGPELGCSNHLNYVILAGGASSPEWVQPTAERGGFLLCYVCCFVLFCLLACFLRSDMSAILCVRICLHSHIG
jgi:hypothetical protein